MLYLTGAGSQDEVVNFEVEIRIANPNNKIRPGMSCDADIQTETKNNVISIPIQCVTARVKESKMENVGQGEDNGDSEQRVKNTVKQNKPEEVIFLADNGKAKMVNVKTGISDDSYIEVESGLNDGDVVISGPYRAISKELDNGKTISVMNSKSKSTSTAK